MSLTTECTRPGRLHPPMYAAADVRDASASAIEDLGALRDLARRGIRCDAVDTFALLPLPEPGGTIEPMITRYAVLTGALELLPQAMAGLAIIPLQLKMVYRIGSHFGVGLDRNQVKELLATVGIGLTGQVVESMARRLLSGFGRKVVGKKAARLVGGAAGPAITFATTFALGHVAPRTTPADAH